MVDDQKPPIEPEPPRARRRKTPPAAKLPPIAERADDLEAIKKAVEDAAAVSGGLWLSYLFVLLYIAVAAGAVTHADLLLETPVKLPFLNDISLPLKAFFFLAPFLFLIIHAYTLAHFVLLADKVRRFHDELHKQIDKAEDIREALRRQLPSNIFVQFLAGPKDIRVGGPGWLLKLTAWTTLVFGPILLLLLLQIQFLPYHDAWITWTHRIALLADFGLLCWAWPKVLRSRDELRGWRWWTSWAKSLLVVALGLVAVLFSWAVATFPGEWQEENLPSHAITPSKNLMAAPQSRWFSSTVPRSLHDWLFVGSIDDISRRRKSWFSNTLVLPGFNLYESLKIDDPDKVKWQGYLLDLRGRDLNGAVFYDASLPKVDLAGAQLQDASFRRANLQGASLAGARLQGASLKGAQLQGASLTKGRLQGASLRWAHLQGALLNNANLQGAFANYADFRGASLENSELQGASFFGAQLQAASLSHAQLQGACLSAAEMQGASFTKAAMTAIDVREAIIWRARFDDATMQSVIAEGLSSRAMFHTRSPSPFVDSESDGTQTLALISWKQENFKRMRAKLEKDIQLDERRISALNRIDILDCESEHPELASCDEKAGKPAAVVEFEQTVANASVIEPAYKKDLAVFLGGLVCNGNDDAIRVLRGLSNNGRINDTGVEATKLVDRIMRADCPIAVALTEDDRAKLRAVAKEATEEAATVEKEPAKQVPPTHPAGKHSSKKN